MSDLVPATTEQAAAVFAALADPTRRQIFETVARTGRGTATALSHDVGISRQATAKHLSMLADAGLASAERSGRETIYRPDLGPLGALSAWVTRVEGEWSARLDALAEHLDATKPDN